MFDVDGSFEPIVLKIEGEEIEVKEISEPMIRKLDKIRNDSDNLIAGVRKQFCYITGMSEEKAKNIPYRKIRKSIQYIMDEISGVNEVKNSEPSDSMKK